MQDVAVLLQQPIVDVPRQIQEELVDRRPLGARIGQQLVHHKQDLLGLGPVRVQTGLAVGDVRLGAVGPVRLAGLPGGYLFPRQPVGVCVRVGGRAHEPAALRDRVSWPRRG